MSSTRKPIKRMNVYDDELRMYNEAKRIRRGKSLRGYPPSHFEGLFSYKQPRRNEKGCGDVKRINTVTGEVDIVHCDDISNVFKYKKPPKHSKYALRYDKTEAD